MMEDQGLTPSRSVSAGRPSSDTAHPDFSPAVLEDLYRYPRKRKLIAWPVWAITGFMGGHRFYLNRIGTGVLMFLTAGGGLLWWIIDAFLLNGMVDAHNRQQEIRERGGLPPLGLELMPALHEAKGITGPPAWAARRSGLVRLVGDAFVLLSAGVALGVVSAGQGEYEALVAVLALIAITNLGARWQELARLPVLRELDRWTHRLRLFYYTNDPGGPLSLLFRPLVGPLAAVVRKRGRAEVRLYLQLGAAFAIVFVLLDLVTAGVLNRTGGDFSMGALVELSMEAFVNDAILTFVMVYAFVTPIGATLTTHLLLERTDRVVWALSALSVGAIAFGLVAT